MNISLARGLSVCGLLLCALPALANVIVVDKTPDQGPYWSPLDGNSSGTYVYANSFTLSSAANIDTLGTYIFSPSGILGSMFRYELWADNANSPDPNTVLGVTAYHQISNNALALDTGSLGGVISLSAGVQYWIIASTVGQASTGNPYQLGAHTPGTDGGTFWFSNDPAGVNFDGVAQTPEMAIYASLGSPSEIPEPSTFALLALPAAGLLLRRRRTE